MEKGDLQREGYAGEFDCPPQGSETAFTYVGESYFDFEVGGQKLSCDFHDSEDSLDQGPSGVILDSESSKLPVNTIGSGLPSTNGEGNSSFSDVKWSEQDEPMAVWVKWRGMWQAGIQCARADWPLSTLKAKPTHDRKKYLVIFFPRTRNYSWADVLLVRPINEFPLPIPYRTHKVGVEMVKDLTLARRFIMQKLSVGMINIIDQLHSEALIETARNVMVWKEFAMEASRCKDYSDIGRLLLKLQNLILQCCFSSNWLQHSLQSWLRRCQNANSAESVEMLKEELVDSILWNEVHLLLNGVAQTEFNSEWKSWKQEIMKTFSMSNLTSNGGDMEQQFNDSPPVEELQISRKRPKLVVRRADTHNLQVGPTQCSKQSTNVEIDSGIFDGPAIANAATSEIKSSRVEVPLEGAEKWGEIVVEAGNPELTPINGVATKSLDSGSKFRQCIAFIESKGRQCVRWANDGDVYCCVHLTSNFVRNSEKKEASPFDLQMCRGTTVLGTKCKHRALIGASFCKKHCPQNDARMMSTPPDDKLKRKHETPCKDSVLFGEIETTPQLNPISIMDEGGSNEKSLIEYGGTKMLHSFGSFSQEDAQMCGGTTVLGTKCKHRALTGTSFCKKHGPRADASMMLDPPDNELKRKRETPCNDLSGEIEPPLEVDPISIMVREGNIERSLIETPEQSSEMPHCIGLLSQEAREPCLESPKRHSLYCEKHLPNWLKRARNGKDRIISKEVFVDLLRDCSSREQKLHLHQACELFYRLFKSILSIRNPVPKEVQLQWAFSEASKDVSVGKVLTKLVFSEKERLKKLWGFAVDKKAQNCSSVEEPSPIPIADYSHHDNENGTKCKICAQNFSDDQSLGLHWMESHTKEAKWFFRGYACAICLEAFTNKKVLESHVQERHHAKFAEQCMLLQCIPCGGHFGNFDELWVHVLAVHPSSFSMPSATQQRNLISFGQDSSHKLEAGIPASVENIINSENQSGSRKFICKFCGLKFDLLPDLGRHHQAAHMEANPVGPRLPKRGIRFYAHKLKSGRLTRPSFRKGLGAASYKIRNRAAATSMKKRIQLSGSINNKELRVQSHVAEADSLGRLADSQCADVARILFSEIKKSKPRPSNLEILWVSRSACCKVSLQALLEEKYGILPEHLYLKAAKLCSEQNILVDWHQEGFNCPKGCKRIADQPPLSPLYTRSDAVGSRSALPPDAMMTDEWEMDECHYVVDSQYFRQEPIQKTIILCDDISFGQELVPIACVVDENLLGSLPGLLEGSDGQTTAYSMPWEGFTYIRKPLFDQSLGVEAELGCACAHLTCSSETCEHVYLFDNDYEDAKDIYGNPMTGRFAYDEKGRIILEEGYLVYECNQQCNCSRTCQNRVLQNGVRVKLEVFKTEEKGWAVRAGEPILRGTFVCEYIGEVINDQEATKRQNRSGGVGCSYFYEIDAHSNDMSRLMEEQVSYIIDATNYGNVSRYINHSCLPNLMSHQVLVESMDCQLAHIGLYASRDIATGEELTYDYRYKLLPGEGCPCHCGAPNCKGRLY